MAAKLCRLCSSTQLLLLLLSCLAACYQCRDDQQYSEKLFLKLLPDRRASASFEFSTSWDVHPLDFSNPGNGECCNDVI